MSEPIADRVESPHPTFARVLAGEFRTDADYATYRRAGTDDWLLIHTVGGGGRIVGSQGAVATAPGDTVLLRPRQPHDYAATGSGWHLAFAHFHPRPDWLGLLEWPQRAGDVRVLASSADGSARVLEHLRRAAATGPRTADLAAVNALESALLVLDAANTSPARADERVLALLDHIAEHLDEALDLDALAAVIHLSPSRVSHLFRDATGETPQRYVERARLQRASLLLRVTDLTVAEVARQTGWGDPLYFSRRFRKQFGAAPTGWRDASRP
ncbi:helix-turn-helix domain-containing protein [Leifsonia sp. NPDC058194]|uniref:helix-turn-helix domain-containing protein n=1 Tax=Leifsonia sp. NPDC058194 TaxID=3346374 RepID=UPI0036D9AEC2